MNRLLSLNAKLKIAKLSKEAKQNFVLNVKNFLVKGLNTWIKDIEQDII
jgi:hypothetical protein